MKTEVEKPQLSNEDLLFQLYPSISPESLDTSRVTSILSDQMSFKVNDLLLLKDISKYVTNKDTLIACLKMCDFFKFSENSETVFYDLPDGLTVFSILNFPPKKTKEEIAKLIELDNLSYSRLYRKSVYWVLATNDKETVICSQNSLREMIFDDTKVKYDIKTKAQILKMIKDIIDKSSYSKEASSLGIDKKVEKKEEKSSHKGSDTWKRRGDENVSSFDSGDKPYYKKTKYDYKRNRFNSDNAPSSFQRGTAQQKEKMVEEIEIDMSNLKYPLNIKYKYSFQDMQQFLNKLQLNQMLNTAPKYLSVLADEIISNKPKEIIALSSLINQFEKEEKKPIVVPQSKFEDAEANSGLKIPKINPLCSMPKMYNKFDMVPGNIPQYNNPNENKNN